jgi:aromatic-L-amino-acid decarboxylase
MAEASQELGAWLHVDGAYGLAFYLIPEKKHHFSGLKLADSACWDPHKQFGVPIPNSILFAQRKEDFNRMAIFGEYFNREDDMEPNPGLKSPPSTRPLSALPLVATFRYQGMKNILERLSTPLNIIGSLAEELTKTADIEVCHQPEGGLLCIRVKPEGSSTENLDQIQRVVYERIKKEGKRSISMTRLAGRTVLRIVVLTPHVSLNDLLETIKVIRNIANQYVKNENPDNKS